MWKVIPGTTKSTQLRCICLNRVYDLKLMNAPSYIQEGVLQVHIIINLGEEKGF